MVPCETERLKCTSGNAYEYKALSESLVEVACQQLSDVTTTVGTIQTVTSMPSLTSVGMAALSHLQLKITKSTDAPQVNCCRDGANRVVGRLV